MAGIRAEGRRRVVLDRVRPEVDGGRFPIKRVVGEWIEVEADAFADGHDRIRCELLYRHGGARQWSSVEMTHQVNDTWLARFKVHDLGPYVYTVRAWIDTFETWRQTLAKRAEAGQDVSVDLTVGADLLRQAADRAGGSDRSRLREWARRLRSEGRTESLVGLCLDQDLAQTARRYPDRSLETMYPRELSVRVDRPKALFSTWYEMFPRSCGKGGRHGTFADCERLLPEIARMGFDVLYLPPIHPIGTAHRKGRNNSVTCQRTDPGSPWAIGSAQGGHKAVHPRLGSLAAFRRLVRRAQDHGLEIALDLAFQCSPDHPYVKEHPDWFRWRPDGTVQYAENPPKKYEDILPLNFESAHWQSLWEELRGVVLFWIDQGVRLFRVDNPHTKPFQFWDWLIDQVKQRYPEVIFLSEAFTRPKVMHCLAKGGFDQSYTYFTWRNTKYELQQYLTELTQTEWADTLRPNFWPNTPDILPEYLQHGGRPAFIIRLLLAATLSSNYGLYGPTFELCVNKALDDREEYLDSEKFEIRPWDRDAKGHIKAVIERVNRIRRQHASLQQTRRIRFLDVDNEQILGHVKVSDDGSDVIVTLVNLDPHHPQSGHVLLPLERLEIDPTQPYLMHDLLSDDKYLWQGARNYVELDPRVMPGHILHLRRRLRRETDFDYFL